jgi:hypothetical protein
MAVTDSVRKQRIPHPAISGFANFSRLCDAERTLR